MIKNVDELFEAAFNLEYPKNLMTKIDKPKPFAFFPGGPGTFDKDRIRPLNEKKYIFLGQDFGTMENLQNIPEDGSNKQTNPTWRNMLKFIECLGIKPEDCFFTNTIMGVRESGKPTGKSPAWDSDDFILACREFFKVQMSAVEPEVVFVMGNRTAKFISEIYDLQDWKNIKDVRGLFESGKFHQTVGNVKFIYMTHPSLRPTNISKRWRRENDEEWKSKPEKDEELNLTKEVMKIQSL